MLEARNGQVIPFPNQVAEQPATRQTMECQVATAPGCLRSEDLRARCTLLVHSFEKSYGFSLPPLVFHETNEMNNGEWSVSMSGRELHHGKLSEGPNAVQSLFEELLSRSWKFFTYDFFRTRLQELEEWEPFLVEEVKARLDLVLTWQALQSLLRQGGTLHRLSSKLERILVETDGRNRDGIFTPRMLAALRQA